MTEYDYSPEAYERYITKQQSIARWVERQSQEAPRYANPFLPSENGEPERPHLLNNDDRRRSVTRSFSTPIDARHNSPSPARHHHRSHSNANGGKVHTMHLYSAQHSSTPTLVQQDGSHSHGSRSHSHSRSSSRAHPRPPPSRSQNYAANNPAFTASQTQLHRSGSHRSHGSSTAHHTLQYASTPGQPVIMQRGKQTYVVVPSRGGHVEVRSPNGVYATSPTRGPASAYPAYPMPSKKPPLLKRLFHGAGGGSHEGARRANVTVISGDSRRRRTSFF